MTRWLMWLRRSEWERLKADNVELRRQYGERVALERANLKALETRYNDLKDQYDDLAKRYDNLLGRYNMHKEVAED